MARSIQVVALACFLLCCTTKSVDASVLDIRNYGAVAGSRSAALNNTLAVNYAFRSCASGSTVLIPKDTTFYILGGILVTEAVNVTFQVDGNLTAVPDFDNWPLMSKDHFAHITHFINCTKLTITGSGTIDGDGIPWWTRYVVGKCGLLLNPSNPCPKRPKAVVVETSSQVLIEGITSFNSPSFNFQLDQVLDGEVRYVTVMTEQKYTRALKKEMAKQQNLKQTDFPGLQPQDLNTDGIDPQGKNIWIHHVVIYNDDDSIAVKPVHGGGRWSDCSENILIEDSVMHGVGASIGSVGPHVNHNCVRNVTFRNISMPKTGKGIYIKSNPTCEGNATAEISEILYEDITITQAEWWPIWIGPQQQQEPGQPLGEKCSLSYPIQNHCPTQGCVSFTNITLRRVKILEPLLSPGILLGNVTNPMRNITFDNVVVNMTGVNGLFPYKRMYQTEHVYGQAIGGTFPDPGFSN